MLRLSLVKYPIGFEISSFCKFLLYVINGSKLQVYVKDRIRVFRFLHSFNVYKSDRADDDAFINSTSGNLLNPALIAPPLVKRYLTLFGGMYASVSSPVESSDKIFKYFKFPKHLKCSFVNHLQYSKFKSVTSLYFVNISPSFETEMRFLGSNFILLISEQER